MSNVDRVKMYEDVKIIEAPREYYIGDAVWVMHDGAKVGGGKDRCAARKVRGAYIEGYLRACADQGEEPQPPGGKWAVSRLREGRIVESIWYAARYQYRIAGGNLECRNRMIRQWTPRDDRLERSLKWIASRSEWCEPTWSPEEASTDRMTEKKREREEPKEDPQPPSGKWAAQELKAGRMVKAMRTVEVPSGGVITSTAYRMDRGPLEFWSDWKHCWRESRHTLGILAKYDVWQPAEDPKPKPEEREPEWKEQVYGLPRGCAEDSQPVEGEESKTVDLEIDWSGPYPVVDESDVVGLTSIPSLIFRADCLGYVVNGLESLPPEQLPQMPEVWARTGNSWDMPLYLYHLPCSDQSRFYERRKAHAMRFEVRIGDNG